MGPDFTGPSSTSRTVNWKSTRRADTHKISQPSPIRRAYGRRTRRRNTTKPSRRHDRLSDLLRVSNAFRWHAGAKNPRLTRRTEPTILRPACIAVPIRCFGKNLRPHAIGARTHRPAGGRAGTPVPARPCASATLRDRVAGRHASRQDYADARDGRARRADKGPRQGRRARRDWQAGARSQRGYGVPAVHQLPVDDGGGQDRFTTQAAQRRSFQTRYRRACQRDRRQAAHRTVPAAPARRASGASSSVWRWRARWPRTRR
jgi:hypothetical protein